MTGSQLRTQLTRIIDEMVMDNNPTVLDDDLADVQADAEERYIAIDQLLGIIENYREDL